MTVSSTTSKSGPYAGSGTTGPFVVGFRFLADSHLQVIKTSTTNIDTTLVITTDYTVTGAGSPTGTVTLTTALAVGEKLTIIRNVPATQEVDYVQNDPFPAESHEQALDKLTMISQQVSESMGRSIRIPASDGFNPRELPAAASRALSLLGFDSGGDVIAVAPSSGSAADVLNQLANTSDPIKGDTLIGVKSTLTGGVARTQHDKNQDMWVSVKDFGAIGTANPANEATDTAAFAAALATGRNVFVPEGTYYTSTTLPIGYGQCLYGAGTYKTYIRYSGTGSGIYMGSSAYQSLIYNCELRDLTLFCTNRATTVNGVELQNCVYFLLRNLSIFGSGSPNSGVPAERVLYGSGVYLHDNTIIGELDHVSCRLWEFGRRYATDAGDQSRWTAAIIDHGQGELANVMRGIIVGDPTVPLYSGVGLTLRDLSFQGCYTTGINVYAGDNTVIENCYFEGNANYDIAVGTPAGAPAPIGVKIINNTMNSEDIGTTPYGTFPYLAKVYVDRGSFTKIRDNNMSISTSIPLISIAAPSDEAVISGNRLNSAIATTGRISNSSTTTITRDNHPEAATVALGVISRALDGATATVAYTGLGFKPTSIEFFAAVDTTNERSIGGAGLTNSGYLNRCMSTDSTGANLSSADCIRIIRPSAGNEQKAALASFDNDGFTLNWTKVGAPSANTLLVNYIARR